MTLIRNLVLGLIAIVGLIAVIGLFLPRDVSVERSVEINAPASTVFTVVNTLQTTPRWSPWLELDPATQISYEGPPAGIGAKQLWSSENSQVGTGTQEIIESEANRRVRVALDLGDMGTPQAEFRLEEKDGATELTWGFETELGANPFGRYMGLMLENFVGPDYERGLNNLKAYIESLPQADFSGLEVSRVETPAHSLLTTRTATDNDPDAMGIALGYAYLRLANALDHKGAAPIGAPVSISVGQDSAENGGRAIVDAGLPVMDGFDGSDLPASIELTVRPAGSALRAVHRGSYAGLPQTYAGLLSYAMATGADVSGASWNEYVGDPAMTDEAELVTHIYLPIK